MISKKKISYYQQFKRVCLGCFFCYFVRGFAVKGAQPLVGAPRGYWLGFPLCKSWAQCSSFPLSPPPTLSAAEGVARKL